MKPLSRSVLVFVAAIFGLGLGFTLRAARRSLSPSLSAANPGSVDVSGSQRKAVGKTASPNPATDDSPLATKLEHDLSMSSGVTRWLYWLEAIEKAVPSDFPRLARLTKGDPTALRFLATRWAEIAPRHLFETLVAASKIPNSLPINDLARALFDEWPRRDPEAVIAALNEPLDVGNLRNWRMDTVNAVLDQDAERGLKLMAQWHIENYGPRMNTITKWAAADPRHAAEFTLANSVGYVASMSMDAIGKEWAKSDPSAALQFASANPGNLGSGLAASALKEWASRNLNEAADWLANTDDRARNRLSPAFVETWAKQDAGAALEWCQDNLAGSTLAQAVGAALRGAASNDPAAAGVLVLGMDPSPARTEGAAAVAHQWFPEFTSGKPAKPEAIAWLGQLDSDSVKRVLDDISWNWATSDPKTMASFLSSSSADQVPASSDSVLARLLARKNPAEALEWASQLPEARGLKAGADAFAEWHFSQPDAATRWLNDLPSTDPRHQPFFESLVRSLAYDPQGSGQLAALSASERVNARNVIAGMTLPEDRRARLLDLLNAR
jgi:hypothetical protein